MPVTFSQLIVWLVIGLLAGWLTGTVVGLGRWTGLGVGLVGALIGGVIFNLLGILPGLEAIAISLRDIVAAVVGSFIFLLILWIVRKGSAGSS